MKDVMMMMMMIFINLITFHSYYCVTNFHRYFYFDMIVKL